MIMNVGISRLGAFKIIINMPRDLIEKVGGMNDQIDNISRNVEILEKNQKEMLAIKNTVTNKCL